MFGEHRQESIFTQTGIRAYAEACLLLKNYLTQSLLAQATGSCQQHKSRHQLQAKPGGKGPPAELATLGSVPPLLCGP